MSFAMKCENAESRQKWKNSFQRIRNFLEEETGWKILVVADDSKVSQGRTEMQLSTSVSSKAIQMNKIILCSTLISAFMELIDRKSIKFSKDYQCTGIMDFYIVQHH